MITIGAKKISTASTSEKFARKKATTTATTTTTARNWHERSSFCNRSRPLFFKVRNDDCELNRRSRVLSSSSSSSASAAACLLNSNTQSRCQRVRGRLSSTRAMMKDDDDEDDDDDDDDDENKNKIKLEKLEKMLGRSAMLGFAFTTILDSFNGGLGPIEQIFMEEKIVVTHYVNPINIAKDLLEVTGLYVESILIVWFFLSGVFLLAIMSGMKGRKSNFNQIREGENNANTFDKASAVVKEAWREQVEENRKWETFNGRLAMLGITASFVGDYLLAEGPMEQVAQEIGVPVIDQEIFVLVFLSAISFLTISTAVRVGRRALEASSK
jgi:photosystem II 22kDa protein